MGARIYTTKSNMRALVISGGGANIDFMAMAYRALEENGVEFDLIVGNSSGAIMSAAIGTNQSEMLYEMVSTITDEDVFSRKPNIYNGTASAIFGRNGLVPSTKLYSLLHSHLHGKEITKRIGFGAVNEVTGMYHLHTPQGVMEERDVKYVMASSTIPGLWAPVKMDGMRLVDGGVLHHRPIGDAIHLDKKLDLGIKEIWIISSTKSNGHSQMIKEPRSWIGHAIRGFELIMESNMKRDFEAFIEGNRTKKPYEYVVVAPEQGLKNMIDFDSKDFLTYGYERGIKAYRDYVSRM